MCWLMQEVTFLVHFINFGAIKLYVQASELHLLLSDMPSHNNPSTIQRCFGSMFWMFIAINPVPWSLSIVVHNQFLIAVYDSSHILYSHVPHGKLKIGAFDFTVLYQLVADSLETHSKLLYEGGERLRGTVPY